ncbi:m84.2 protein [Murid betaherpesvirus 1]|nr:m84.2 protein [Murid betaherpesvirus 1]AWV68337.1 m84.2 protein [Murid betaherpesvirus 1]
MSGDPRPADAPGRCRRGQQQRRQERPAGPLEDQLQHHPHRGAQQTHRPVRHDPADHGRDLRAARVPGLRRVPRRQIGPVHLQGLSENCSGQIEKSAPSRPPDLRQHREETTSHHDPRTNRLRFPHTPMISMYV